MILAELYFVFMAPFTAEWWSWWTFIEGYVAPVSGVEINTLGYFMQFPKLPVTPK